MGGLGMTVRKISEIKNSASGSSSCPPGEALLKSYFLAPNAENRNTLLHGVRGLFEQWFDWRQSAHPEDGPFFDKSELTSRQYVIAEEQMHRKLLAVGAKFMAEIPRHSPRYIGHMYSEYSIPAFFGHLIALMYNPNNISSESSHVGIQFETQAIAMLAKMIGFPKAAIGHFTSGGTVANLEMLYRAKIRLNSQKNMKNREKVLLVPQSAHYCWEKGIRLVGDSSYELLKVAIDRDGRMCIKDLNRCLERSLQDGKGILGVVSVLGTTELGVFDPVDEISRCLAKYRSGYGRIWHHVDAAYGGFFSSMLGGTGKQPLTSKSIEAIRGMGMADSVTLDPHKLGYVPYASGCFICKRSTDYRITNLDAPYLDYRSGVDPGPFTLEGSRTVAGALAVCLTNETIGLASDGIGKILSRSILSAKALQSEVKRSKRFSAVEVSGSNIVCFADRGPTRKLSLMNQRTLRLHKKMKTAASHDGAKAYFVSKTTLGKGYQEVIRHHCQKWGLVMDAEDLVLIRCTTMNPFFSTKHSKTKFSSDFVEWAKSL